MKKRVLISVLLIICMCLSFVMPSYAQINDLKGHWAEREITEFINKNYIGTYADGTFKPDQDITRAEFVSLINKVFGFTERSENILKDVSKQDKFYNDVRIAIKAGYIEGYEDKTFRPNNKLSREEAAVIITRVLQLDTNIDLDKVNKLKDKAMIADWSRPSINAIMAKGYMKGYDNGAFGPKRKITRAEAVTILNNIIKAKEENISEAQKNIIKSIDLTNGAIKLNFESKVEGLTEKDFTVSAKLDDKEYTLKDLKFGIDNNFTFTAISQTIFNQKLEVKVNADVTSKLVVGESNAILNISALITSGWSSGSTSRTPTPTIVSIQDIKQTITSGSEYELPNTVVANMSNNTTKEVAITWTPSSIDTSIAGIYNFEGSVQGYTPKVKLELTIKHLSTVWMKDKSVNRDNYYYSYFEGPFEFLLDIDANYKRIITVKDLYANEIKGDKLKKEYGDVILTETGSNTNWFTSNVLGWDGSFSLQEFTNGEEHSIKLQNGSKVELHIFNKLQENSEYINNWFLPTVTTHLSNITVERFRNQSYTLPSTLEESMSNGTKKIYNVTWKPVEGNTNINANTEVEGTYGYTGTMVGHEAITLTLTVSSPQQVYVDKNYSEEDELFGITKFNDINSGIEAVANNGTVDVAAGTYNESLIFIDKPITLRGPEGDQEAIINVPRMSPIMPGLIIGSGNVIIDGISITSIMDSDSSEQQPTLKANKISAENDRIKEIESAISEILTETDKLNTNNKSMMVQQSMNYELSGVGIVTLWVGDCTIKNTHIYGMNAGVIVLGGRLGEVGAVSNDIAENIKILNNYIHGNRLGIGQGFNGVKQTQIQRNLFEFNNLNLVNLGNKPINAKENWWGSDDGVNIARYILRIKLEDGIDIEPDANIHTGVNKVMFFPWALDKEFKHFTSENVTDIRVDDDWDGLPYAAKVMLGTVDYYKDINAFSEIRKAVKSIERPNEDRIEVLNESVVEPIIVNVAPGVYTRGIDIDVPGIVLNGPKAGLAPSEQPNSETDAIINMKYSWRPAIYIGAENVTIDGFTIKNAYAGVMVENESYNEFISAEADELNEQTGNVIIKNNRFVDNYYGIDAWGNYSAPLIVKSNLFKQSLELDMWELDINNKRTEGVKPVSRISQRSQRVDIPNNKVWVFKPWGTAISLYDVSDFELSNNTISRMFIGINVDDDAQSYSDNKLIMDNSITGNTAGLMLEYSKNGMKINNNSIYDNNVGIVKNYYDNNVIVDATKNWWNTVNEVNIASCLLGDVQHIRYFPWALDGTFKKIAQDTTKPVITLLGENPVTLPLGDTYVEEGAIVTDSRDIGLKATITGQVNKDEVGSYKLKYNAVDVSGNQADEVTRIVNVVIIPVQSISLDKLTLELNLDATEKLTATVSPANATYKNVIWESSDTSVANVDNVGNVKAVGLGTATITAKSVNNPDKTASCEVTVKFAGSKAAKANMNYDSDNDAVGVEYKVLFDKTSQNLVFHVRPTSSTSISGAKLAHLVIDIADGNSRIGDTNSSFKRAAYIVPGVGDRNAVAGGNFVDLTEELDGWYKYEVPSNTFGDELGIIVTAATKIPARYVENTLYAGATLTWSYDNFNKFTNPSPAPVLEPMMQINSIIPENEQTLTEELQDKNAVEEEKSNVNIVEEVSNDVEEVLAPQNENSGEDNATSETDEESSPLTNTVQVDSESEDNLQTNTQQE